MSGQSKVSDSEWRRLRHNSLRGHCKVRLPPRIEIADISVPEAGSRIWAQPSEQIIGGFATRVSSSRETFFDRRVERLGVHLHVREAADGAEPRASQIFRSSFPGFRPLRHPRGSKQSAI